MPFLTFALMYSEAAADTGAEEDCFIYCAFNAHWEEHTFTLPVIPLLLSVFVSAFSGALGGLLSWQLLKALRRFGIGGKEQEDEEA